MGVVIAAHPAPQYVTAMGAAYCGDSSALLQDAWFQTQHAPVQLVFTSPPFPLSRKKRYGNLQGKAYVEWLAGFGQLFKRALAPDGSLVVEIGNSFEPGQPTMSTLPYEALMALKEAGAFYLCQEFVWFNPARLPSPAQWVNVERIRVKDAFTRLWWMSSSPHPKANNRAVLTPYSDSMQRLLRDKSYNPGARPSQHNIGATSFLTDNGGAVPPNVLVAANTASADRYSQELRRRGLAPHPARMPASVVEFFVKFLTEPGDCVLDPFAGSNTTGAAAEVLGRRWVSIEMEDEYVATSHLRFLPPKGHDEAVGATPD